MEIPVIVEPTDGGYRARCRHPVEAETSGSTRYDATQALESALKSRIGESFVLCPLEATPDKPWVSTAGSVPDDEATEMWLDAIAEYRREQDARDRATPPPAPNTQPMP